MECYPMPKLAPAVLHGIDLTAPDGISRLLDFHYATFGDAVMEANEENGGDGRGENDGGNNDGKQDDEQLGEGGKKALQAERARADEADRRFKAAQAELDRLAEAKLSDIEKANKAASDAQAELTALKSQNARLAALAKHPVPEEYQDLVTGTDEASYLASAEKLSRLYAEAQGKHPKQDPVPGSGNRAGGNAGSSVTAGRDLYAERHNKTK